jgi:hypothetical protein
VLSTSPPTQFSTSAPSTWKLTSISFANGLPLVLSVFFVFQPHHNSSTPSPKGFPPSCLLLFSPVSTPFPSTFRLRGGGGVLD